MLFYFYLILKLIYYICNRQNSNHTTKSNPTESTLICINLFEAVILGSRDHLQIRITFRTLWTQLNFSELSYSMVKTTASFFWI
jgi:hypothetical protein